LGKVTSKYKHERLDRLIEEYWEIYRRGNLYRSAFRKFERDKRVLGKSGKADFNHIEYKNLIRDFEQKYNIPPINPQLSFDKIIKLYRDAVRKGCDKPPPLEVLFFKGKQPIWVHTTSSSEIFIPKPLTYPLSYYLIYLDSILESRGVRVRGARNTARVQPFIESPSIYSNGISLNLNLNATVKTIKTAIKNILLKQGAKEQDIRGKDFRNFLMKMAIFDIKEKYPDTSFKEHAKYVSGLREIFYPNKSLDEIAKFLSDEYNDAVRLINPGKKKVNRTKKDYKLIEFKDFGLEYIGSDYTSLEISRLRKGQGLPRSRKVETKGREDITLFDKREAKKPSLQKIFTPDKYSQDFLKKLIPS